MFMSSKYKFAVGNKIEDMEKLYASLKDTSKLYELQMVKATTMAQTLIGILESVDKVKDEKGYA